MKPEKLGIYNSSKEDIQKYYCSLLNYYYEGYFKEVVLPIKEKNNNFINKDFFRGLTNIGNICFRNSIFQILLKTPILSEYLLNLDLYINLKKLKTEKPNSLMLFFHYLSKKYYNSVNTDPVEMKSIKDGMADYVFDTCPLVETGTATKGGMGSSFYYFFNTLLKSKNELPFFDKKDLLTRGQTKMFLEDKQHYNPLGNEIGTLYNSFENPDVPPSVSADVATKIDYANNEKNQLRDLFNITFPTFDTKGIYSSPILSLFSYITKNNTILESDNEGEVLNFTSKIDLSYLSGMPLNITYKDNTNIQSLLDEELLSIKSEKITSEQLESAELTNYLLGSKLIKIPNPGNTDVEKSVGYTKELFDGTSREPKSCYLPLEETLKTIKTKSTQKHLIHIGPIFVLNCTTGSGVASNFSANTKKLNLEEKIKINDEFYSLYGIVYHHPGHYNCCVKGNKDWFFLNDSSEPKKIEGRVPEIYRNRIELLFYHRSDLEFDGFINQ